MVVRFARGDVDGPRGAPVTRAGAQLFVVGAGQTASLRAPMRISGELPDGLDPDEWIEASLVTRGPWSRAVGYRAGLSEPPPGARLIVGTHADALTDARLEDMERFIAALSLAPLLAMAVALVF